MSARIAPVPAIGANLLATAERAAGGSLRADANVYRTLATSPRLLVAWLGWGGHVARHSTLTPRLRELVILRTALLAKGRYPLVQHVRLARAAGVEPGELTRIAADPGQAGWDPATEAALVATDQLHLSGRVDDACWGGLAEHLGPAATLDLIATAAFYRMACWVLTACRTPLDPGQGDVGLELGLGPPAAAPASAEGRGPAPIGTARFGPENTAAGIRVEPVPLGRWPADLLAETATWPRFAGRPELRRAGVYGTLANRPPLFAAIGGVMAHLLVDNSLSDAQRELVIVRSCLLDRGAYPYRQHVRIAGEAGIDEPTLQQLTSQDPELDDPASAALVAAIDGLHRDDDVTDETWARLTAHLRGNQILDAIVTAGFYGLISFVLNVARTPLEPGAVELPAMPFEKGPT